MMIPAEQISEIHRLRHEEGCSVRRIARRLRLSRDTVSRYLACPWQPRNPVRRGSKLDPFKPELDQLLARDGAASAVVLRQRLAERGYDGGITLLRVYLQAVRGRRRPARAYVRQESCPGERCEADWGHFGALDYDGGGRKLYAFALVEAHSRMLYLEFTHSQNFETFTRCLLHAGQYLGGLGREIWFDNLATAVAEHDGRLVRFQPRFLAFARELGFGPRACNRGAGWEKGKTERAIGYVR
jgi:transposase